MAEPNRGYDESAACSTMKHCHREYGHQRTHNALARAFAPQNRDLFESLKQQRKVASENRYASAVAQITYKCLSMRMCERIDVIRDRLNPVLAKSVYDIYCRLGGLCPLTGTKLIWDQTCVDTNALDIIRVDESKRYLPGNVSPIVHWVRRCANWGIEVYVVIAREYAQFTKFVNEHSTMSRPAICREWAKIRWSNPRVVEEFAREIHNFQLSITNWPLSINDTQHVMSIKIQNLPDPGDTTTRMNDLCTQFHECGQVCYYTGVPIWPCWDAPLAMSIDRIDNSRPHVAGNMHLCCNWANKFRSIDNPDKMFVLLNQIATHTPKYQDFLNRITP